MRMHAEAYSQGDPAVCCATLAGITALDLPRQLGAAVSAAEVHTDARRLTSIHPQSLTVDLNNTIMKCLGVPAVLAGWGFQ